MFKMKSLGRVQCIRLYNLLILWYKFINLWMCLFLYLSVSTPPFPLIIYSFIYLLFTGSVAKSEKIYYRLSNWIGSTQSIISSIVATQIFKSYILLSIYTLCTLNYKTIHIYFYSVTHLFRVCELHRPLQKSY